MKKILILALIAYLGSVAISYLIYTGLTSGAVPSNFFKPAIQDVYISILIFFVSFSVIILGFKFLPNIMRTLVKLYFFLVIFGITLTYVIVLGWAVGHPIIGALMGLLIALGACILYYMTWYSLFNFWGLFLVILISPIVGLEYSLPYMLIWLSFFALYDYAAVFLSGAMKFIVVSFLQMDMVPQVFIFEGELKDIIAKLTAKTKPKLDSKVKSKKDNSGLLGLGDLIIPSTFAASIVPISPLLALIVAFCGFGGLMLNFNIISRYKIGLPAIPLIFAPQAAIVGIYLGLLQNNILYIIGGLVVVPIVYLIIRYTAQNSKRIALAHNQLL